MKLGDKIKYSRIKNGFTQKELADRVGVAQNTISCYEKGTKAVSIEMIDRLSSALDESREYFLANDDMKIDINNKNVMENESIINDYIELMIEKGKIKDDESLDKHKDALWEVLKNDIKEKLEKKHS